MSLEQTYSTGLTRAAHLVMKEILPLKDQRFVDPAKFRSLADRVGIRDIEQTIYFLRELHLIVSKLPMKIFNDPEDRLRMVTALQDAMDAAVDEEDELLDAEGYDELD